MTKRRTDWVVIDSKKQEARCNRCGVSEPLAPYNGVLLNVFLAFLNSFGKAHKGCKEKL